MKYLLSVSMDAAHSPISTSPQHPAPGKDQGNSKASVSCTSNSGGCGAAGAAVRVVEGVLWFHPTAGTGKEGKLYHWQTTILLM